MDYSFRKDHRITLKKELDLVFSEKQKIHVYPFLSHLHCRPSEFPALKVVISVPKKKIKKAHDRNRIKRLIREALRTNKQDLIDLSIQKNITILFSIVYLWEEVPSDNLVEIKLKKLLSQICAIV